jgi:uncharacterized protein involved in response to NO
MTEADQQKHGRRDEMLLLIHGNMNASGKSEGSVSFFGLCAAEPFRIFFPLGMLFGISGVSLWPLYFLGIHRSFYPAVMHAYLMVQGFLAAFVLGFLGTAMPRLVEAPPLARWELWTLLLLHATAVGLHIGMQDFAGDWVFLALLVFFLLFMARRFALRKDMPPPGFVLVALGFLNAVAGTALLAAAPSIPWAGAVPVGAALLVQGWVLLLILGVGGFLLPQFLGLPQTGFPVSRTPPPGWTSRALSAAAAGIVIDATLFAEGLFFHSRAAHAIRCITVGGYLLANIPFHRAKVPNVTLTVCLRAALVLLVAGLAFPLCWPLQRVAGLHVIFIGGFSLMVLSVATRVVLGHSGNRHLFPAPLPFLRIAALLLVAAAVVRAVADFIPVTRNHWLNGASYAWMLGAAVWSWRVLPKVRIPDPAG